MKSELYFIDLWFKKNLILWKKIYVNWKELEYICIYLLINIVNVMLFLIILFKLSINIFLVLYIFGVCKRGESKL